MRRFDFLLLLSDGPPKRNFCAKILYVRACERSCVPITPLCFYLDYDNFFTHNKKMRWDQESWIIFCEYLFLFTERIIYIWRKKCAWQTTGCYTKILHVRFFFNFCAICKDIKLKIGKDVPSPWHHQSKNLWLNYSLSNDYAIKCAISSKSWFW